MKQMQMQIRDENALKKNLNISVVASNFPMFCAGDQGNIVLYRFCHRKIYSILSNSVANVKTNVKWKNRYPFLIIILLFNRAESIYVY